MSTIKEIVSDIEKEVSLFYADDRKEEIKNKYHLSDNALLELQKFDYLEQLVFRPIYDILSETEKKCFDKIAIKCFPLSVINAHAIRADDGNIIVFNQRLLALIFSYHEIQYVSIKNIKDNPSNEKFSSNFKSLIDCYLSSNSAKMLEIYDFNVINIFESSILSEFSRANEMFIMAHEMAHIFLGHLTSNIKYPIMDFMYNAENLSQEKEFAADIQAVIWLSRYFNRVKNGFSISLSIEIFMLFHLIECNLGYQQHGTHPTAIKRLINIKDSCKKYLTSKDMEFIEEMIKNANDENSFKI